MLNQNNKDLKIKGASPLPSSTCFQKPTLWVRIHDWLRDPWHRAAHLSPCIGANCFPLPPMLIRRKAPGLEFCRTCPMRCMESRRACVGLGGLRLFRADFL